MTQRTHPLEWAALGCSIVGLSYTEWSLAVAAGAHPIVAIAVPGALDIYAVRAMRARRHVPGVVLAMVGVNALSYLVHAGVVPVTWPVLIVVSAIAPLVFWAVHVLGYADGNGNGERSGTQDGNGDREQPREHEHVELERLSTVTCDWCGWTECPEHLVDVHKQDACTKRWEHTTPSTLDEHARSLPVPVDTFEHVLRNAERSPQVTVKLPLPDGYEPAGTAQERAVAAGLERYGNGNVPTIKDIKADLSCGTSAAQAVQAALKERNKES